MSILVGLGLIALSELLDESESESPEILNTALDGAFDSIEMDGVVRECVKFFITPSGVKRCAKFRWNPSFCPASGTPNPKKIEGGWYGDFVEYRQPSQVEGKSQTVKARYKVVEAASLITSHIENKGFIEDIRYPSGVQDRDYSNKAGQDQIAVIRNAQNLDPNLVLGCSVTSSEGTPIAWGDVVLSGNSRAMSIRYSARNFPTRYKSYKKQLIIDAYRYGLNSADISSMKKPILVREVFIRKNEIGEFASLANKPISRELDTIGKSIELAKLIPDGLLLQMDLSEGETLRAFLRTSRGTQFVSSLIPNIVPTERGRLFKDDGRLTAGGMIIFEDALFAKVFDERREIIEALTDGQRRALEFALPELVSIKTGIFSGLIKPDWNLNQALGEAILFADRNLKDTPIGDYLRQSRFVGGKALDFGSLWGQSISLLAQFGSKPRVLRDKIAAFRKEAEDENTPKLFKVKSRNPVDVLKGIIGSSEGNLF